MSRKKVWSWRDSPPRGTLQWLQALFAHGQEYQDKYALSNLAQVDDGSRKLRYVAKLEEEEGVNDRRRALLRQVLLCLPPDVAQQIDRWVARGGPAIDEMIERMRAPSTEPGRDPHEHRWDLARLLCATDRYDEGRALMQELTATKLAEWKESEAQHAANMLTEFGGEKAPSGGTTNGSGGLH